MPETGQTFELAGLSWNVQPLDFDEQFEVECILLRLLGPSAGAAVAALAEGFAPAIVRVLRVAGPALITVLKKSFEANLSGSEVIAAAKADATIQAAAKDLESAWGILLDALGETAGEIIRDTILAMLPRLDHREIMRLFELSIFGGKTHVTNPAGETADIRDYKLLSKMLARAPRAKWDLLVRALLVTYGASDDPEEDTEGEGDGDE